MKPNHTPATLDIFKDIYNRFNPENAKSKRKESKLRKPDIFEAIAKLTKP